MSGEGREELRERVADAIAHAPVHLLHESGRNTRTAQRLLADAAIDALCGLRTGAEGETGIRTPRNTADGNSGRTMGDAQ